MDVWRLLSSLWLLLELQVSCGYPPHTVFLFFVALFVFQTFTPSVLQEVEYFYHKARVVKQTIHMVFLKHHTLVLHASHCILTLPLSMEGEVGREHTLMFLVSFWVHNIHLIGRALDSCPKPCVWSAWAGPSVVYKYSRKWGPIVQNGFVFILNFLIQKRIAVSFSISIRGNRGFLRTLPFHLLWMGDVQIVQS